MARSVVISPRATWRWIASAWAVGTYPSCLRLPMIPAVSRACSAAERGTLGGAFIGTFYHLLGAIAPPRKCRFRSPPPCLHEHEGRSMGFKEIAKHLNARQLRMRGGVWGMQKVYKILSSATYSGELFYKVIDSKADKKRPPADWIAIPVDPIVEAETFHRARQRREGRRPSAVPPRLVSSPIHLTGLLECGQGRESMTLTTGKSGKYRYYKCTTRVNKGNAQCASRNIPMEKLDGLVLDQLADRVFAPKRLQLILLRRARTFGRARRWIGRRLPPFKLSCVRRTSVFRSSTRLWRPESCRWTRRSSGGFNWQRLPGRTY
jgi:hypothetical protein